MKNPALAFAVLLFLAGLTQACTITPGSTTATVGQTVSFTLTGSTEATRICETRGSSLFISDATAFSCIYSNSGPKTVIVTAVDPSTEDPVTCTASVQVLEAANSLPSISVSGPIPLLTRGDSYTFQGTASDSDGTVDRVRVRVTCTNNFETDWLLATGTTSWRRDWNVPNRVGNSCTVTAEARDNDRATAESPGVSFSTQPGRARGGTGEEGNSTCVPACSNRQRIICPENSFERVECCSASDCINTCTTDGLYRQPSCSDFQCSYGSPQRVAGQCLAGATSGRCQIGTVTQTRIGVLTPVIIVYNNFASPPGTVSIQCGNGRTSTASCSGNSGNCSSTCTYTEPGTFTPQVSIQGTTCTTLTVSVTGQAQSSEQEEEEEPQQQRSFTCSLSSPSEAETGGTRVEVAYRAAPVPPGFVDIHCGNGKTASASGCGADVNGDGSCGATCTYEEGQYTQTAAIQGVACTPSNTRVTQAPETNGGNLFDVQEEADISIDNFVTQPAVIIQDTETKLTALVKSDSPVTSAVCTPLDTQESSCECTLTQTTEPNPLVDCTVQPPVNGRYQITFTSSDGKTKTAEVMLAPGQTGTIQVVNKQGSPLTLYAVAAAVFLLLLYGAYYAYSRISEKLGYGDKLKAKRQSLLKEIDYAKVNYMKGQLTQEQFQKLYSDKQRELSDLNAKIAELGKKK